MRSISLLWLTFGLSFARAAELPLNLVTACLTKTYGARAAATAEFRTLAPRGLDFLVAALDLVNNFDRPWEQDDRRMRLLDLLIEKNPAPLRHPSFRAPDAAERIRRRVTPLLYDVASRRNRLAWRHVEETLRFIDHFGLWSAEHVPFLLDEVSLRTRRSAALLPRLIEIFPETTETSRVEMARGFAPGAELRFVTAALFWVHGPPLEIDRTLAAWARWELNGRSFNLDGFARERVIGLAQRFERALHDRARTDAELRDAITRLPDTDLWLGGLDANVRERLAEAISRVLGPTSPCSGSLASRRSP